MIWLTGDLHGGDSAWHISSSRFKEGQRGDVVICLGDLGGVWYHDYHTNEKHRRREDFFLDSQLRKRFLWLAVDGNHENFARLFGGEFPLVDIFGGRAYKIREHVYYLKRGDVFTIEGQTFLAFGGASSHDRFGAKVRSLSWGRGYDYTPPRKEGIDWWPEEQPNQEDYDNACRNLDAVGWKVDHVITHTCPASMRRHFLESSNSRKPDPTEDILESIYKRLTFRTWHLGHFHTDKQVDPFECHYSRVKPLTWHESDKKQEFEI